MSGRLLLLIGITGASILTLARCGRIPQDRGYHHFADGRLLLGIPNFWNVVSNAGFLAAGLWGLRLVLKGHAVPVALLPSYIAFFAAVVLVAFGSAWYHAAPDNGRLAWDRLPMALAFMAFLTIVLGEQIDAGLARLLLPLLLVCGGASVEYWRFTERRGRGDLRPYLLVQFLPLALAAATIFVSPSPMREAWGMGALLLFYAGAKVLEMGDEVVFRVSGSNVSGHTLKHLAAAVGVGCFVLRIATRLR
jgi:hypothetical protein